MFACCQMRQGRNTASRITADRPRRSAATPSGPTSGNRVLAKAAPVCTDTRAAMAAPTGANAPTLFESTLVSSDIRDAILGLGVRRNCCENSPLMSELLSLEPENE
ncbi:hypothetical protein D3C75_656890 [compost metagenome]